MSSYKYIGVWLSLVERCVRDAEAAGSSPVPIDHAVEIINERGIDAFVKHICNYCAGVTPKKKYNAQTMPKNGKCINILPNSIEDKDDKHYQLFIRFKDEQKYRKIIQNNSSVYRAFATILRNENCFSTEGPFMLEAYATEYIEELSEIIGQA